MSTSSSTTSTTTTTSTNPVAVVAGLTSTTAPGKIFATRSALAQHYKSDWHRYNLKRREAGLHMVRESDFLARLEAAVAAKKEKEGRERGSGIGHLKDKTLGAGAAGGVGGGKWKNKNKGGNDKLKKGRGGNEKGKSMKLDNHVLGTTTTTTMTMANAESEVKRPAKHHGQELERRHGDVGNIENKGGPGRDSIINDRVLVNEEANIKYGDKDKEEEEIEEEAPPPTIDPRQSLFDSRTFDTVRQNMRHMSRTYGFFVPDSEYLVDLEGLIGYCHEKIKLGHTCLYCQRTFRTWLGCRSHMVDSRHAKIRYERNVDVHEFDVFYDFAEADAEFLGGVEGGGELEGDAGLKKSEDAKKLRKKKNCVIVDDGNGDDNDDDDDDDSAEWEDVSYEGSDDENDNYNDNEMEKNEQDNDDDDDDDDDLYRGYEAELATHGFDITVLGELVFPDGRIIGHRGLARYYKQRVRDSHGNGGSSSCTSLAVLAAKRAAGERVYGGRVWNVHDGNNGVGVGRKSSTSSLALLRAGFDPSLAVGGGGGKVGRSAGGILVKATGGGATTLGGGGGFTALSLYRYRAAVRKSRRDERYGRRLKERSFMNTNRMDKKANRLMNGVSVAHAAR